MATTTKTQTRKSTRKTEEPTVTETQTTEAVAETTENPFAYLAEKEPTDLHVKMARWMTEVTGVEITPKAAQIVAVLRWEYTKSEEGKNDQEARKAEAERKKAEAKAEKIRKAQEKIAALQAELAAAAGE